MNDKEKKNQAHKNLLTDCTVMPQGLSLLHQDPKIILFFQLWQISTT